MKQFLQRQKMKIARKRDEELWQKKMLHNIKTLLFFAQISQRAHIKGFGRKSNLKNERMLWGLNYFQFQADASFFSNFGDSWKKCTTGKTFQTSPKGEKTRKVLFKWIEFVSYFVCSHHVESFNFPCILALFFLPFSAHISSFFPSSFVVAAFTTHITQMCIRNSRLNDEERDKIVLRM